MKVTPKEFEAAIRSFGYLVKWAKTGDPSWVRGYIIKVTDTSTIPTYYARAGFRCRELYNVNFYWRQYSGSELNESDYLFYAWRAYQVSKTLLTKERYEEIVAQAWTLQKAELNRRLRLREETNKRNPRKRPSIKGRCVRNYILEIITDLVSDQKG